ncbi:MAG: hypothetical protein PHX83_04125 [Acidobacteriia bacterium]|nr:hypothetical protein [Terriglobia bacterium]
MNGKDLFAKLEGTPAQILIVIGLALALFAPVWARIDGARVSKAKTQFDQAGQIIDLEMEQFKKDQEAERRKMNDNVALTFEERSKKEEELRQAAEAKQAELEKSIDTTRLKRAWLDLQTEVAGSRATLWMGWSGRLLLLLGLLTLAIQSKGLKQKVVLIVLLAVMFSSLAGLNFDFGSVGHLGESSAEMGRAVRGR